MFLSVCVVFSVMLSCLNCLLNSYVNSLRSVVFKVHNLPVIYKVNNNLIILHPCLG